MTDEDTITRLNGDKITRNSLVNDSITYYSEEYEKNITDICDFSEGSEINTLHNSFAVEVFSLYKELVRQSKQKYVNYATGVYLDELGCEYHLTRKQSEVATGTVTFTCSETLSSGYTIPAGTILLGRGTGYEYVLASNVTLTSANTPVNGEIYSKITGARYNTSENTITTFQDVSSIRNPVKVTNPSPVTGGVDAESDDDFRLRILNSKKEAAYGTITNYSNTIIDMVDNVHDVEFVKPTLLTTNSAYPNHYKANSTTESCTECTRVIFVNAYSKPCPDDVIDSVEYLMTQENNIVIGQLFHIEKAQVIPIYLSIHVYVTSLIDEDILLDHLEAYFNGDTITTKQGSTNYKGLNIRETLYKNNLITVIENIPGVSQVESIHRLKFADGNTYTIPTAIGNWTTNGGSGYTYTDTNGYIFSRTGTDTSSIDYWGERNFDYIEIRSGNVFSVGVKSNIDENTEDIFTLKQTVVTD